MNLNLGDSAPNFRLLGVDGRTYTLEDFQDKKVLVVIFSCNHCPYVQAYEQRMVNIQRDFKDKGVALVAINSNDDNAYPEDSFEKMVVRAKEKGYNFPYLRDAEQKVASIFGPERTPEIFLFDESRRLRYHGRIDDSKDPSSVRAHDLKIAIQSILEGRQVLNPETSAFGCSIKWSR